MKNTIDTTSRIEAPTRRSIGNSPLLARLSKVAALSALTIIAACSDDNGRYTPGNQADAGISSDSGITGTDTSGADAGSTVDAGVDSTVSGTDASDSSTTTDTSETAGTAETADTSTSQDTTPVDTTVPSTPDIAPTPVKVTKPAPADEWMSEYKPGMELPIQHVIVSNKPYSAVVGFGHKDQIKPLGNDFAASVNGADVYTMKMADLPQGAAGTKNFRVVTTNNPAGAKIGTYVTTLTGEKAQDGVTPLYDQGAILPVLCDDGEYNPEDATLLTQAMTMTGKMEFNHNLEEMRDTYAAYLQANINKVFAAAGKAYAPICEVQMVTPGKPGIVDGQVCPVGCLVSYVTVQPLAGWTPLIQK